MFGSFFKDSSICEDMLHVHNPSSNIEGVQDSDIFRLWRRRGFVRCAVAVSQGLRMGLYPTAREPW